MTPPPRICCSCATSLVLIIAVRIHYRDLQIHLSCSNPITIYQEIPIINIIMNSGLIAMGTIYYRLNQEYK